jgi:cytochrome c biogenesis protein CcmG/thiol:disulfide interchange protein DsbE
MSARATAPRRSLPVWPVLIAAIVVAGVIAVVVSAGGDDDDDAVSAGSGEVGTVTIDGAALPAFQSSTDDEAVGETAPTITGTNFADEPATIPAEDGNAKAIFFVAHWCPHCQAEVPRLAEWLRTHDIPEGLDVDIVSTLVDESRGNFPPSEWLEREGVGNLPTIADDENSSAYQAYGAGGLPYVVFLDKDNNVVLRTEGEYGDDPEAFTEVFENLAAGEPVEDPR